MKRGSDVDFNPLERNLQLLKAAKGKPKIAERIWRDLTKDVESLPDHPILARSRLVHQAWRFIHFDLPFEWVQNALASIKESHAFLSLLYAAPFRPRRGALRAAQWRHPTRLSEV